MDMEPQIPDRASCGVSVMLSARASTPAMFLARRKITDQRRKIYFGVIRKQGGCDWKMLWGTKKGPFRLDGTRAKWTRIDVKRDAERMQKKKQRLFFRLSPPAGLHSRSGVGWSSRAVDGRVHSDVEAGRGRGRKIERHKRAKKSCMPSSRTVTVRSAKLFSSFLYPWSPANHLLVVHPLHS
jgi:hypothetical protein